MVIAVAHKLFAPQFQIFLPIAELPVDSPGIICRPIPVHCLQYPVSGPGDSPLHLGKDGYPLHVFQSSPQRLSRALEKLGHAISIFTCQETTLNSASNKKPFLLQTNPKPIHQLHYITDFTVGIFPKPDQNCTAIVQQLRLSIAGK